MLTPEWFGSQYGLVSPPWGDEECADVLEVAQDERRVQSP